MYGKTIELDGLTLQTAFGYYTIPWHDREAVYDLRAAHIASSDAVIIRLGSVADMVPNTGESADLECHNDNDVDGETVRDPGLRWERYYHSLPQREHIHVPLRKA